ncbi:MAG: gas vesicle protein K [Methanoregulaceae archaeon]|jgi:hypothetical protein
MLEIDEKNLKQGVLGLVIALVEIIEDALKLQALKRMDSGVLNDEEIERLGRALQELRTAIEEIKEEQCIAETVQAIREDLDDIVDDALEKIVNPEQWKDQVAAAH